MHQNDSIISTFPQQESFQDLAPKTKFVFKDKNYARPSGTYKVKVDSTHIKDSLNYADSLKRVNQKKITIVKIPAGHQGKTIPSSPGNENWVFGVLIFLLFLFLASLQKSGAVFSNSLKNIFKKNNPTKLFLAVSTNIFEYRLYFTVFFIGVISLYVYESFCESGKSFSLLSFAIILGINTAFYAVKILFIEFVGNVFFSKRQIKAFKDSFFNLFSLFSIVLFVLLVVRTYNHFHWMIPFDFTALILLSIFYILLLIKVFQIFFTKLLDTFYIFLYLCTLEILPILILFRVYDLIV